MKITVAICTWNRARLLEQTLQSLRRVAVPPGIAWELLVVNNNCSDDTDAVIARHSDALPVVRLYEPAPGHSHARNCALRAATGELIIWTDDDVLVDGSWLVEYITAARCFPEATFFGGTIEPWFAVTPPRAIQRHLSRLKSPYLIKTYGECVRPLSGDELPCGANMAFRTDALRDVGFNTQLGRLGKCLRAGDDSEVLHALQSRGDLGVWVGTAKLRHYTGAERLTLDYLWEWFRWFYRYNQGRRFVGDEIVGDKLWKGAPRWMWRKYAEARLRALLLAATKGYRWLRAFRESARWRGIIDEARQCTEQQLTDASVKALRPLRSP